MSAQAEDDPIAPHTIDLAAISELAGAGTDLFMPRTHETDPAETRIIVRRVAGDDRTVFEVVPPLGRREGGDALYAMGRVVSAIQFRVDGQLPPEIAKRISLYLATAAYLGTLGGEAPDQPDISG